MEWNGVVVAVKMKVEKMLEPHPTALKMLEDHTAWPQLVVEPAVPAAHAQNALVKTPLHGLVVGEGAQAEHCPGALGAVIPETLRNRMFQGIA